MQIPVTVGPAAMVWYRALLEGCAVLSGLVDLVVAGPILWLALCEAAALREAPLALSPPPFASLRRSRFESLQMTLLPRAVDHEAGTAPVPGRGAGPRA